MLDTTSGINEQNAGLFSDAAYAPIRLPVDMDKYHLSGWTEITSQVTTQDGSFTQQNSYFSNDGNDEFRVFKSTTPGVRQIVIAFKGTDNVSNFKSDVNDRTKGSGLEISVFGLRNK